MRDKNKSHFALSVAQKAVPLHPRMPKTVQACGFDLLFIYKHFI